MPFFLSMLLRYNNYDRAVINTVPHNMVQRWYLAHRQLTDELRKPKNELWVKLKPGKVTKLWWKIRSVIHCIMMRKY